MCKNKNTNLKGLFKKLDPTIFHTSNHFKNRDKKKDSKFLETCKNILKWLINNVKPRPMRIGRILKGENVAISIKYNTKYIMETIYLVQLIRDTLKAL